VSQWSARRIDRAAEGILVNSAPSITRLALLRSELHRLQDYASDYVESVTPEGRTIVENAKRHVEEDAREDLELPFVLGEEEVWREVATDVRRVTETVDRALAAVQAGAVNDARTIVRRDLRNAVDQASSAILQDIEVNVAAADAGAQAIKSERRWAM